VGGVFSVENLKALGIVPADFKGWRKTKVLSSEIGRYYH
jgi:hypothetical protein